MMPYFVLGSTFLFLAILIYVTNSMVESTDPDDLDNDYYVPLKNTVTTPEISSLCDSEHVISHKLAFSFSSVR